MGAGSYRPGHETQGWGCGEILFAVGHQLRWNALHHGAFTSLRVVCNNTLQMALRNSTGAVKVSHSTTFDPAIVKEELGLGLAHWDEFKTQTKALAARPVATEEALRFFSDLLAQPLDADNQIILTRPVQQLHELYQGAGMGSELASSQNTAWGWSMR